MTEGTDILNRSFGNAGRICGYDSVSAEFAEFKEFKVKWRRSCGWAEFEVSDYVKDAPENVLTGLAETIFSKISRQVRNSYPQEMLSWITSDDFVRKKQPIYLTRAKNLARTPVGKHVDLDAAYRRLIDMGLMKDDKDIMITWTKHVNTKRVGYCSLLMKVVIISSILDTPDIPTFVSDYVLYHELIHVGRGFDPFGQRHGTDFHLLERRYPMHKEAEEWLKRLQICI
ncbi:MAG: DUF45 domain-containing protein [Methanomassiliicoccaceae archaeon]|jgi:hypothetical protein|nr:DUF45 domain-containing protein [Methanomassiliicoccaceae archaeon]